MRTALVTPMLLVAAVALAADPHNTIEAVVTASGADDCGGTVTLSWSGQLRRDLDRREAFATLTVPTPVLSMTPSRCEGKCARSEYDTAGASLHAHFERFPDGQTKFGLVVDGIRVRRQLAEGEGCRSIEDGHSLTVDTFDESPFRLTPEELEAGFERSFGIQGDGFPGYTGTVQVRLRKGAGEPDAIVEGPHCACGVDGTAEVTARSTSHEVVFERFEVKGAPAGTVRRNEGGKVARLLVGNAARAGGPVEAVAVYRHRGKIRRAPPHTVHLALVEKPETRDNEKWGGKGGSDFAFDDGVPGHIEFEAEGRAWLDGRDASTSLRWAAEGAGYLRPDPAAGARTRFQADGLPRDNASFGRKGIRAVLEQPGWKCESEPREVRIFYWAYAENGPQGKGTPNWAWYYRQTRAWNGVDFSVGDFDCGVPAPDRAGGYDWCHDRIYLHPRRPSKPCRMPPGTPPEGVNRYIDCFAQTIRHEAHHRRELMEWWGGRTPEPTGNEDPDGDLVPAAVEAKLGLGCRDEPPTAADQIAAAWQVLKGTLFGRPATVGVPPTQYSCALATSPRGPGRPFPDVIDSEINAYWVGWSWPTGSADGEDWAWPGKNWPGD